MKSPDHESIQKALAQLAGQADSRLITDLNSCVHCGLCAESCLYYLATRDDRMIPGRKVELMASLYRRYHTLTGRLLPGMVNARDFDEAMTAELTDQLFGACTLCGRCTAHCSVGVDIAHVVATGRSMLAAMGKVPATLQSTVNAALETGNNMAIPEEEFIATIEWMEDEMKDEVGDPDAVIPLNEPGKDILYTLNPREPKFFPLSIAAMAKIFYAAGESWTLSTRMYDVTNYAYFSCHDGEARLIAGRLRDELEKLGGKRIVLAECGHGTRAFRWEAPNYLQEPFRFDVLTSVELIAGYLRDGRIKLDPDKIKEKVTLHDPCNLVRLGGITQEQRYILRQFVPGFVEMTPHGIDNHCCGGGGGQLAMSEYNERRMSIARIKAEQIRKTEATTVVTPCHNCVDQLSQINAAFTLGVKIMTLAEIVADALIFEPKSL